MSTPLFPLKTRPHAGICPPTSLRLHSADLAPVYSNALLINLQMEALHRHREAFQRQSDIAYMTTLRQLTQAKSNGIRGKRALKATVCSAEFKGNTHDTQRSAATTLISIPF